MARTAFVDAGPQLYPIGVTFDGVVYYHERFNTADGSALAWSIRTAGLLLDVNWRMLALGMWPDFKDQVGPVTITVYARETPDGEADSVSADPLAPGDVRADFMISGRIFEIEYSGESFPAGCRLGTPVLDATRAGKL